LGKGVNEDDSYEVEYMDVSFILYQGYNPRAWSLLDNATFDLNECFFQNVSSGQRLFQWVWLQVEKVENA
jgi:hypothetical protein